VTASGNLGDGLYMEYLYGDATISDSTFNNNDYYGIYYSSESYQSGGVGEGGLTTKSLGGNVYLTNVTVEGNGSDGADLYVNGNLEITCSSFKNNGDYAISAGVYGNATFSGVSTTGEVRVKVGGEFIELAGCVKVGGAGSVDEEEGLGGKIVPVVGGENVPLDCGYSWTALVLPNTDEAHFGGFCLGDAQLNGVTESNLPGVLPDGFSFGDSFTASYLQGGTPQQVLPTGGFVQISFVIPAELQGKDLVILFWDATAGKWIEIPLSGSESGFSASNAAMQVLSGLTITPDGHATATVNFSGTFILAVK
jgi:hypothetical protein